ncbi:unnamed protein product [Rhizoctonia solani]|uniref:Fungal-type protein kinase domain-containing protein n=1 Tax=Rhizoctonia solani TaxID=456999 RepID=A0A8H2X5D2_9AGAM|nr:unnamed protein product [Rhizoctonia solani]
MDKMRTLSSFQQDSGISPEFASSSSPKTQHNAHIQAPLHAPCLPGRSTVCFDLTNALDVTNIWDESPMPLVAELYWLHRDRPWEDSSFRRAHNIAKSSRNLHFVTGPHDIDLLGTLQTQEELGINADSPSPPRAVRMIIFERLIPITELQGDTFLIAWVECIICHFVIWNRGFCYQDISLAKLMARFKDGRYYGVLSDWDSASRTDIDSPRKELTATIPYVAIRLLTRGRSTQRSSDCITTNWSRFSGV